MFVDLMRAFSKANREKNSTLLLPVVFLHVGIESGTKDSLVMLKSNLPDGFRRAVGSLHSWSRCKRRLKSRSVFIGSEVERFFESSCSIGETLSGCPLVRLAAERKHSPQQHEFLLLFNSSTISNCLEGERETSVVGFFAHSVEVEGGNSSSWARAR